MLNSSSMYFCNLSFLVKYIVISSVQGYFVTTLLSYAIGEYLPFSGSFDIYGKLFVYENFLRTS